MTNCRTPKTIRELYFYIKAEFHRLQSIQNELTEHKKNHWKIISIMIGIAGLNLTMIIFIIKFFMGGGLL